MQRTRFGDMACSIARTMDVIGEPWSPLILRNIYVGITRFEQIQQGLGISRKVLAERLRWLVENGVLERQEYSSRPPRHEYTLTAKGLELCDLLLVMVRWGDRWTAGRPVHRCSTGTTPAARSATSSCTARCATSRCTPPTSTCCPAPERRPRRPPPDAAPGRDGQESTTAVFWQATRRHRPSSLAMTYSGLPSLSPSIGRPSGVRYR